MFNEVLIWNDKEQRNATLSEIERLIAEELLFINYVCHGSDSEIGKAFIDLQAAADGFLVKYEDAG